MNQPDHRELAQLLLLAWNCPVQDFYYFPEVILAGSRRIDRNDFDRLLAGGYLTPYRHDSFGRYFRLTARGEEVLYQLVAARTAARKKKRQPARQEPMLF